MELDKFSKVKKPVLGMEVGCVCNLKI